MTWAFSSLVFLKMRLLNCTRIKNDSIQINNLKTSQILKIVCLGVFVSIQSLPDWYCMPSFLALCGLACQSAA